MDYVEAPPNYLVVVSGFYLVDARQAFEKRRHVFGVDVSQRLQGELYLAGLESHYPVGVQAVFVPLVHPRLVNDREYPFGGCPELGRVQAVVPLFYVGILADSRVNRLVFLQPVDFGGYAAQFAVHELGQRLIARVILYKPLTARRGYVVFIVLIQEVGVDFPEQELGYHPADSELGQDVFLCDFAARDDGDFVQIVFAAPTVQIRGRARDGYPAAYRVSPVLARFAFRVESPVSDKRQVFAVVVLVQTAAMRGVVVIAVLEQEAGFVEVVAFRKSHFLAVNEYAEAGVQQPKPSGDPLSQAADGILG